MSWQVLNKFFKTYRRNNKLADLLSLGRILCGFFTRRLEKYVHFVAKKLERYIISVEIRLDFSIHTTRQPASPKSHADLRTVKKQSSE